MKRALEPDSVSALERCAYAAWPAEEVEELDGWRVRATRGVTRRANSAWTAETGGRLTLEERVERVEAFYAARALPSLVQISAASAPPELDRWLGRRGYQIESPVSVQTADVSAVARHAARDGVTTTVEGRPFEAWFEISCRRGRFAAVEEIYRALLQRIGAPAAFAIAELDGAPAAAGMAVIDGAWGGVFSMSTLAPQRRRGLAGGLLAALARRALERGAGGLYLQVERENQAATALYARFGFSERYRYHYRVGPAAAT
jgi:ribosomal protein S18 acetylase RimI-like enzyme